MSRSPIKLSWPTLGSMRRKRVEILLSPEAICIQRAAGKDDGTPTEVKIPLPENATPPSADAPPVPTWQAAVDAFEHWLDADKSKLVGPTLVLSNRFVRFVLVPWSPQAKTSQEILAIASARLKTQYGDMDGWTIRVDSGRYGDGYLSCAIETSLLKALQRVLFAHRIRRYSIQPHFIACWNQQQSVKALPQDLLFVTDEAGTVVMATRRTGRWHSVRAMQYEAATTPLRTLIEREVLLQGFVVLTFIQN